jgi:hypothetical protein
MTSRKAKLFVAAVAIFSLVLVGGEAFATPNAIDVVPAATLLLPYFEVDLANGGVVTLFSINNASAAPQLAHITLWTNLSRPTLDFTVYLTGYDVYTVNLGSLFSTGSLPPAPGPGPSYANNIDENAGAFSISTDPPGEAIGAASDGSLCRQIGAVPLPAALPANFLSFIRRVHTGLSAPAGFAEADACTSGICCGGFDVNGGNTKAIGYITIDVVTDCSPITATNPLYFSRTVNTREGNVLWGDWFLADPLNDFAQGDTLVHIENYPEQVGPGYTFYGRYVAYSGEDNREPLATTWGVRYFGSNPPFDASDLLCWRDEGTNDTFTYFNCSLGGNPPDGQPMSQDQLVIFDEEENPVTAESPPFSPSPIVPGQTPCPYETNRSRVGGDFLTSPFAAGWLFLNLNTQIDGDFNGLHQAWVGAIHGSSGRFSVGYQGVAFDHASNTESICIGPEGAASPLLCPLGSE